MSPVQYRAHNCRIHYAHLIRPRRVVHGINRGTPKKERKKETFVARVGDSERKREGSESQSIAVQDTHALHGSLAVYTRGDRVSKVSQRHEPDRARMTRANGEKGAPLGGRQDYNRSHYCAIDVPGGIFPFDNAVTLLCI